MNFSDKTVLITGAGSPLGIGRATAVAFAQAGANVVCFDRNAAGVRAATAAVKTAGASGLAVRGDVSSGADVRRAVREAHRRFGRLDILVNNAAIASFRPLIEVSEREWDRMVAVNLKGYFLFCREVARSMLAHRTRGCIINVSTIGATLAGERKVHYCASKAGINLLTRGLALELGPSGIRVNSVSPGAIETNIIHDPAVRRLLAAMPPETRTPLGRLGAGGDVASAILYLASDAASFITGADLLVDGGLTAGQRFPKLAPARRRQPRR